MVTIGSWWTGTPGVPTVFQGLACDVCGAEDATGKERFGIVVPGYVTTTLSGFELICGSLDPGGEKYTGVDRIIAPCGFRLYSNCRWTCLPLPILDTVVVTHVVAGTLRGTNELLHIPLMSGNTLSRGAAVVTVGLDTIGILIAVWVPLLCTVD